MTNPIKEAAEELLRLAEAATPGPWVQTSGYLAGARRKRLCLEALASGSSSAEGGYCVASFGTDEQSAKDAAFVAACRPLAALVARLCLGQTSTIDRLTRELAAAQGCEQLAQHGLSCLQDEVAGLNREGAALRAMVRRLADHADMETDAADLVAEARALVGAP